MALAELSRLDEFEVADESVDIRGFSVYNKTDEYLGDIDELIVDPVAMKVRYVVIDAGTWLEDKKFIAPIGMVRIDEVSNRVYLDNVTKETIQRLPVYDESQLASSDYEQRLLAGYYPDRAAQFSEFRYDTEEAFRYPERFGAQEEILRRKGTYGKNAERREGTKQEEEIRVPVTEEELKVGKREVERGGVRVESHVTETPVEEEVRLRDERVNVERRPVDRPATGEDLKAFKEETFEVTEKDEEPVISKRARVKEEVVIGKDVEERSETVRDTVRRKEVEVEPLAGTKGFEAYETDFRKDFETRFANKGYTYDRYVPAYRYGYTLATGEPYRGKDWAEIEPEARREWEKRNPNTWDLFKDSIRYAWNKMRGRVS